MIWMDHGGAAQHKSTCAHHGRIDTPPGEGEAMGVTLQGRRYA